jgi:hypothetical protein
MPIYEYRCNDCGAISELDAINLWIIGHHDKKKSSQNDSSGYCEKRMLREFLTIL